MKKTITCIVLALATLFVVSCGAATPAKEADPNLGHYVAVSGSIEELVININDAVPGGLSIDLQDGGRGELNYDTSKFKITWTLDGEALKVVDDKGELTMDGTLSEGVMVLENILDSGLDVRFIKEGEE